MESAILQGAGVRNLLLTDGLVVVANIYRRRVCREPLYFYRFIFLSKAQKNKAGQKRNNTHTEADRPVRVGGVDALRLTGRV